MKNYRWFWIIGLLLFASFLAMYKLGRDPFTSHECFVSLTAEHMLDSSDWVDTVCNGKPRLQKPPLPYWSVAIVSLISHRDIDEFVARLPSAFFAIASVMVLLFYASKWLGFRAGLISAAIWACSLSFMHHSHKARPDVYLMFFILICLCSFYSAITAKSRKQQIIQMLIFWFSFALANLAKGPVPFVLLGISLCAYVIFYKQWKTLPKLLPFVGTIIVLAIILPWPVMMINKYSGSLGFWKNEFFDRFFGHCRQTDKPLYYYIPVILKNLAPWSIFAVCAFFAPFYKIWDKKQHLMKYIWIVLAAGTVFMSFNDGKRHYYIMPYFPLYCVLIAIVLEDMVFIRKAYSSKFITNIAYTHIAVVILGAVGLVTAAFLKSPEHITPAAAVAVSVLILLMASIYLFRNGKLQFGLAVAFLIPAVLFVISSTYFIDDADIQEQKVKDFCLKAKSLLPADTSYVTYKESEVVYAQYLDKTIPNITDVNDAISLYNKGTCVITSDDGFDEMVAEREIKPLFWQKDRYCRNHRLVSRGIFYKVSLELADNFSKPAGTSDVNTPSR